MYNKQASYDDAVRDFLSLEPADVRKTSHCVLYGKLGGEVVFVRGPDPYKSHIVTTLVVRGKMTRVINYVSL